MDGPLSPIVARFGYLAVFVGVFLESAGVPVPGETLLLAGAFFAHQGSLALAWVIAVAAAAAVLGDNLGYVLGRRGGRPMIERRGRRVGLTPARLAAIDAFFARHGARAVFFGRFVTGVRVFVAVAAGIARVPWPHFLAWNAAGALVWSVTVGLAGYVFGQSVIAAEHLLGRAGLFAMAIVGALAVAALAWRHGRRLTALTAGRVPAGLTAREILLVVANAVSIGVFARIAEEVAHRRTARFDEVVAMAVLAWRSPGLDLVMMALSAIGAYPFLAVVVAAVAGWAWRRGDRGAAGALVAVSLVDVTLNALLKTAFERGRPDLWALVVEPQSYSFPSGHAMGAAAIYGFAAVVVARLAPQARPLLAVATPLLVLGIGLSRVYLGVHWPTDVLAGFAAGALLLLWATYLLDGTRRAP
ncbi:MAG TPA: bifunctional DedA family/phosphatase PAP2 family protein [Thermodesulfobacteriota bacterium]